MNNISSEALGTIQKVAKRLAPRYKFGYHEAEDIYQYAVIYGIEALSSYDDKRPLENYLAVVVGNKLKSFKRDNYERQDAVSKHCESKKNLMEPIPIDNVDDELEPSMSVACDTHGRVVDSEMFKVIDDNIPAELRSDYLKIKHGEKILKSRKKLIEAAVIDILERNGYGETW